MQLISHEYSSPLPTLKIIEALEEIIKDLKSQRTQAHRMNIEAELDEFGRTQVDFSLTLVTTIEHL